VAITRVFRVEINAEFRTEFEAKFAETSVDAVMGASGSLSAVILKPTPWAPDEYAMISEWQDENALRAFAGDDWSRAVIPPGMQRFVKACWVHHYSPWS
jgi:heme-degrading monooxygenase HmoA